MAQSDLGTIIEDHLGSGDNQLTVNAHDIVEVVAEPSGGWVWVRDVSTLQEGYIPVNILNRKKKNPSRPGSISNQSADDNFSDDTQGGPETKKKEKMNEEYIQAALKGDTVKLTSLMSSLDLIDSETLEAAQNIINLSGKDEAKIIAQLAITKKTRILENVTKVVEPIFKKKVNKNSEWLEATMTGDSPTLTKLLTNDSYVELKILELSTLLAEVVGDQATIAITGFTFNKKRKEGKDIHNQDDILSGAAQSQMGRGSAAGNVANDQPKQKKENKNKEWLEASMKGDRQTLTKLISSNSFIELQSLEIAKKLAEQVEDRVTIIITDFEFNKRSEEFSELQKVSENLPRAHQSTEGVQLPVKHGSAAPFGAIITRKNHPVEAGNSSGELFPFISQQNYTSKQVNIEMKSAATIGSFTQSNRVKLTLQCAGEMREVEIDSTNTKPLRRAVKDMTGQRSAYAVQEIKGEKFSSLLNLKSHSMEVFALEHYLPTDDYITFPLIKFQELLSKDNLVVFLDLTGPGMRSGSCRILIQVDGQSKQGQQFLGLCMGVFGFSYKNVISNAIRNKGKPGERIGWSGYKSIENNGKSGDRVRWSGQKTIGANSTRRPSQRRRDSRFSPSSSSESEDEEIVVINDGILSGLEENRPQIVCEGTVAKLTVSGGDFVIFTQGNPESKTAVHIGTVVKGLDVLSNYIINNANNLTIENTGIHIGTR